MNTTNTEQCTTCGHDLQAFPEPADAHLGLFCPSCYHAYAEKYKRQRDILQAVVNTPPKQWSAELVFDDGVNPFAREELQVVDVGWSDRVLIVESKTVESLQAEVARLQAEIATSPTEQKRKTP